LHPSIACLSSPNLHPCLLSGRREGCGLQGELFRLPFHEPAPQVVDPLESPFLHQVHGPGAAHAAAADGQVDAVLVQFFDLFPEIGRLDVEVLRALDAALGETPRRCARRGLQKGIRAFILDQRRGLGRGDVGEGDKLGRRRDEKQRPAESRSQQHLSYNRLFHAFMFLFFLRTVPCQNSIRENGGMVAEKNTHPCIPAPSLWEERGWGELINIEDQARLILNLQRLPPAAPNPELDRDRRPSIRSCISRT